MGASTHLQFSIKLVTQIICLVAVFAHENVVPGEKAPINRVDPSPKHTRNDVVVVPLADNIWKSYSPGK